MKSIFNCTELILEKAIGLEEKEVINYAQMIIAVRGKCLESYQAAEFLSHIMEMEKRHKIKLDYYKRGIIGLEEVRHSKITVPEFSLSLDPEKCFEALILDTLNNERDSILQYLKLAEICEEQAAKELFLNLAYEEQRHIDYILNHIIPLYKKQIGTN